MKLWEGVLVFLRFGKSHNLGLERGNYHTQACLAFIQHKSTEIVCNPKVAILISFDIEISVKDVEMNFVEVILK